MHQYNIKRNFLQHHSIPICLARSIPIGCVVALLLLVSSLFGIDILSIGSIGSLFGIGSSNEKAYALDSPSATTSLSIANKSLSTTVAPGETGYISSNVTYSASDIANYTLRVTYANGYDALRLNGTGSTILSGAGTGGVTGSSLADNTWGFAWGNAGDTNSSMKYYTVPSYGSTGTAISNGYLAGGSTTSIASTTKKIVFAAKFASTNTNNGHYSTSVLLSLIATPKQVYNYSLSYDANGGSGAPEAQTALTQTTTNYTFTISSTKPTRSGYMFLGWNDTPSATTANTNYEAGKTITLQSTAPSKTLYAVWAVTINNITNMQQMTSAVCTASAVGDEATLTDTRDSSTYTVKKLQDGKCWMTQNLRIVNKSISDADSDLQNATTKTYTIPASNTSGFSDNAASNAYYGNNTTYGAYYTWCAATAGTCTSATTDKAEASGSICPKGWRLPKGTPGTGTNEFANMAGIPTTTNITTSNMWSSVPTKTFASSTLTLRDSAWPAAGYYDSGSPDNVGSSGYYWSSTASDSAYAYYLVFNSSGFNPAYSSGRRYGYSVRCVAE